MHFFTGVVLRQSLLGRRIGAVLKQTCKKNNKMITTITLITKFILTWAITLFSSYFIIILIFIYFLLTFYNKKVNKINENKIKYTSLIKDKEYLLFLNSLFNLYYSALTILFVYLFKNNYLNLYLISDIYLVNYIITFFIIYFILINDYFTLKLFKLFNLIKTNINLFC